jgi:tripartite-type tricarboxylate transporter receptor subunit TctC
MSLCRIFASALSIPVALSANVATAQSLYPQKEIRVLYGEPGIPDVAARMLMEKLSFSLKAPISFENVPGAGGNIAADRAANAESDGHTLYIAGPSTLAVNLSLDDSLSYSPVRDFAPITQLFSLSHVLIVNKEIPVDTVQDFIAFAKTQPVRLTYGHFGLGSPTNLATERFKMQTGMDAQPVSYRGPASLVPDLLAGRIMMCLCSMTTAMPLVRQRLVRPLAVTSAQRSPFAPRLPTMIESGVPDFEFTSWLGLVAPAGTPAQIIAKVRQHTAEVLSTAQVRTRLADSMLGPIGNTPAEFAIVINKEIQTWAGIIKETGFKLYN